MTKLSAHTKEALNCGLYGQLKMGLALLRARLPSEEITAIGQRIEAEIEGNQSNIITWITARRVNRGKPPLVYKAQRIMAEAALQAVEGHAILMAGLDRIATQKNPTGRRLAGLDPESKRQVTKEVIQRGRRIVSNGGVINLPRLREITEEVLPPHR